MVIEQTMAERAREAEEQRQQREQQRQFKEKPKEILMKYPAMKEEEKTSFILFLFYYY